MGHRYRGGRNRYKKPLIFGSVLLGIGLYLYYSTMNKALNSSNAPEAVFSSAGTNAFSFILILIGGVILVKVLFKWIFD